MAARIGPEILPASSAAPVRAMRWFAVATLLLSSCSHQRGAGGTPNERGAGGTTSEPTAVGPAAPGPTDAARELAVARAARTEGRLRDAALGFERVIRADTTAFDARLELAEVLMLQSVDLGRAATLLDEARALRIHDVQVDRLRAWLDELNGDLTAAAADYARVLAARPEPEIRLRRASLLMRVNRVDEAVAEYEKVVSDNPNERGARTTLADIYEHQRRWADAERMLTELERLAPGELSPLRRLEAFYRRSGQVEKAAQTEARVRNLVSPPRSLRPLRPSVR